MASKESAAVELGSEESYSHNGSQDALDMAKLGKLQRLTRRFDFWSALGLGCLIMITWEGLLITFIYGLTNGGPAGVFFGFIFVWLGYACVVASLAELTSIWPTSGGQYHWSHLLSPPSWAPFISYICGWQSIIAWQAVCASGCYLTATMIQGLAVLNYPTTYTFHTWHGTLMMWATLAIVIAVSIFGYKHLPKVDYAAFFIHIAGFIVVITAIATLSPTKATNSDVFDTWFNGGYSSRGISFLAGLQGIVFAFLGADGPIHMAEETKGASVMIPWSLIWGVFVNGVLGIGMVLGLFYYGPSGQELQDALTSPTGYPYEAIFVHATGSVAGATGLSAIVIVMAWIATLMIFRPATREVWAFARDNGLPGSAWVAKIHQGSKLPLNSYLVTTIITVLLSLINIGSSVAFNAVISLTVAGFMSTYLIPTALLLVRRIQAARGKIEPLPWGPWRLGVLGIPVNIIAVCWIIIIFIFSFFPSQPLPGLTYQTMNWSCLAYGATTLFAIGFWLVHGHRTFKGPIRDAAGGEIDHVVA